MSGFGVAHDLYGLGATLYYVLTGSHDQVGHLGVLAAMIQEQPCPLVRRSLAARNNYLNRKNAILYPFWRDELLEIILRAMVRGLPESYAPDRTVRGPEPTLRFLDALRHVEISLAAELFKERR